MFMTLKKIAKTGLATSVLIASGLAVSSNKINAQNIGDSTIVTKTIGLEFLIYDETTNLPIEGAGADVAGKYAGYSFYESFLGEGFYNFEGTIVTDENGKFKGTADVPVYDQVTDVKQDDERIIPSKFGLAAYPNPYNPSTNITFDVLERGNVSVGIYNVLGQEIVKWSGELTKGNYTMKANGGSSKVEFAVVETKNGKRTFKMINLGGNSTPFIEVPNSSGNDLSDYVNNPESNNSKVQKLNGTNTSDLVMDTLAIEWGAPGYYGDSFTGVPVNLSNGKIDTVISVYEEGVGMKFNEIIPGENGVDTVKNYFNKGSPNNFANNSGFRGRVELYRSQKGAAPDSIKFILPSLKY